MHLNKKSMKSRFFNSIFFSKEKAESLKKLRIIQQNLIHVQGLPKSLNNKTLLKSSEYFGQYGTIKNVILSKKINPENNKEVYSVYITYENAIQASTAILCVDSLLIDGKIIRAFFGTTRYCNYFLNSKTCPKNKKCMFLHKLVSNKNIIIDDNTNFSYNEHLNMAKKIIELSNEEIKNILKKGKSLNNILPSIDFIFLTEEQKENYFSTGNISYIKNNSNQTLDTFMNNNYSLSNSYNIINNSYNIINVFNIDNIERNIDNDIHKDINLEKENLRNCNSNINVNREKYQDPEDLYSIFKDSINHILLAKPFYVRNSNIPLNKLEYDYLRDDLLKKGIDINLVLKGCLDCIKD